MNMQSRSFIGTMSISKTVRILLTTAILLFIAVVSINSFAAECRKTGQTCVEGPATRNISGNLIYQGCWRYRSTYECIKPQAIDYCAAISKVAGCWQTSTSCVSAAWNGTCLTEQRTYRCGDPNTSTPPNTVKLGGGKN